MAKNNLKSKDELLKDLESSNKAQDDGRKEIERLKTRIVELEKGRLKQENIEVKLGDKDKELANDVWNEIKSLHKVGMFPHRILKKVDTKFNVDTGKKGTANEITFYQVDGSVLSFSVAGVQFTYRGEK